MKLNIGLKSTLLALSVIVAAPVSMVQAQEQVKQAVASTAHCIGSCITKETVLGTAVLTAFAAYVRMKTKNDKDQFKSQTNDDLSKLFESFSVTDFSKQLLFLADKYIVGRPIKFVTADIPQEDGSTIKGKKVLSQTPYGALGLFDAYVISQIKDFSETVPTLAMLYVLVTKFDSVWLAGEKKASGEK